MNKRETVDAAARGEGCLGRAADDEPVFVLRAKDRVAPATVREWAERARKSATHDEAKVASAMELATEMERWRREHPEPLAVHVPGDDDTGEGPPRARRLPEEP